MIRFGLQTGAEQSRYLARDEWMVGEDKVVHRYCQQRGGFLMLPTLASCDGDVVVHLMLLVLAVTVVRTSMQL